MGGRTRTILIKIYICVNRVVNEYKMDYLRANFWGKGNFLTIVLFFIKKSLKGKESKCYKHANHVRVQSSKVINLQNCVTRKASYCQNLLRISTPNTISPIQILSSKVDC